MKIESSKSSLLCLRLRLLDFIGVWSDGADGFDCPKASP